MKKIFKSIIFLIILVLSFQYYEEKIFKRFDSFLNYAYYKIPKDSIDLLFVGSSHSYCTFNPRLFDHYLKCNSLNLGTDSQSFSITYSAILEILKRQTPKVIVIEVYPIKREPSIPALRPHLDTMSFSVNKLRLIKNSLPITKWGNHLINTFYYHSRWKEFSILKKEEHKGYESWEERTNNKGFGGYVWDSVRYSLTYDIYEKIYNNIPNSSFSISENYLKLLEDLFKICQKKGIKVIIASPPVIDDYDVLNILYNSSLKELMNKYNIDSIDFNTGKTKYEKINFLDNAHLSLAGSDEVSFEMASFLKENYPILLNTKNYEELNRSPEYYFYSENIIGDNNFKSFDLNLEFEKGIIINGLKIYKKNEENFDLFFKVDENKSNDEIYKIAFDSKEININLDEIQLIFSTTNDGEKEFPKYYIRKIKNVKYIYKKNIKIPRTSKYYF